MHQAPRLFAALLLWALAAPALAASVDDTTRAMRAERAAAVGLGLAGLGFATTGVGAHMRWGPGWDGNQRLIGSGVMGGGTLVLWVGSGLAAFSSLRVARARGARTGTGSAALALWSTSIASQLLFAYGAPAALATASAGLSVAQLRVARRDRPGHRLTLALILPRAEPWQGR